MVCAKTVTIDGKDYILAEKTPPQDDKVILIRTRSAGVHVGELVSRSGQEVTLKNAHRVWQWKGANTLSELSQLGGDLEYTRISERVPTILLLDAIELIPCSVDGAKNLRTPRWKK